MSRSIAGKLLGEATEKDIDFKKWSEEFEKLAVSFLVRKGWSRPDAEKELELIEKGIGIEALLKTSSKDREPLYLRLSRIGSKKTQSREERKATFLTLDRAMEHALFSVKHR